MQEFHLEHLNRNAYIDSIAQIKDKKSLGFANLALYWWDRHFSWKAHGCVVLSNEKQEHLSYIFYKIDRYNEYITIHNIFTPLKFRRHGYASQLFELVFQTAEQKNVSRFRMTCVPQSLSFYLTMGVVYWGINSLGDYYCDLPMPKGGITQIEKMVKDTDPRELAGKHLNSIISKVKGNVEELDEKQTKVYEEHMEQLAESYLYKELMMIENK
ncbi:GNAT family N-acetyltransferase [Sulfurovum sp. zt1-1]|uniref:GNAT family N-acetyltransferase n=1 Tax=Sulfurovum zhangzhouensis TaxID=3019067 RepID=A0ABT7QVI7_9BACT|nr:GNAT family N-acetyltransferase [Sulfurovum zhangzhouensis]MDM5270858.1 GNAT family N-acetyltransferase [Sulfurovum zhangzhouensis]